MYFCQHTTKIIMEQGFNKRLKEFRMMVNMTQSEFAETINVTQANVSMLEQGGMKSGTRKMNKPSAKVLGNIQAAYPNLNINWLFSGIGKPILSDNEKASEIAKNENTSEAVASYKEMIAMLSDQIDQLKEDKKILAENNSFLQDLIKSK